MRTTKYRDFNIFIFSKMLYDLPALYRTQVNVSIWA
jgi:hypothetical protein